jgi:hypothetical protein
VAPGVSTNGSTQRAVPLGGIGQNTALNSGAGQAISDLGQFGHASSLLAGRLVTRPSDFSSGVRTHGRWPG